MYLLPLPVQEFFRIFYTDQICCLRGQIFWIFYFLFFISLIFSIDIPLPFSYHPLPPPLIPPLQLIDTLPNVFRVVMKKYNLAPGDFPDIRDFQEKLTEMDFTKFHSLKQKLIDDIEGVLGNDIPRLMEG